MIQTLQTNDGSRNKAELGWIFLIDIVAAKFCTWRAFLPRDIIQLYTDQV